MRDPNSTIRNLIPCNKRARHASHSPLGRLLVVGVTVWVTIPISFAGPPSYTVGEVSYESTDHATTFEEVAAEFLIPDPHIVNVHEHLMRRQEVDKYREAAEAVGIEETVFVGSSLFTLYGGRYGFTRHHVNNTLISILARQEPNQFYGWVTFDPAADDMVRLLKNYLHQGATGVKLYVGHTGTLGDGTKFHSMPLDDDRLIALYDFCNEARVPILLHVNARAFADETERILSRYPDLPWIIPHFAVLSRRMDDLRVWMDRHPNVMIDISFGIAAYELAGLRYIGQHRDEFRNFMIDYQDRILFGTDAVITGARYKSADYLKSCFLAYRFMLELDVCALDVQVHDDRVIGFMDGLSLPESVVCKIYHDNFQNFLDRTSIVHGQIDLERASTNADD